MNAASGHRRARLSGIIAAQASPSVQDSRFEIIEVRLFPVREPVSHRSYSIVRVRTRGGLSGFGEGPPITDSQFSQTRQYWVGKAATSYTTSGPQLPLSGAIDMALL